MNVSSLELCKELYGLSGWKGYPSNAHTSSDEKEGWIFDETTGLWWLPTYDLDYLMGRLPRKCPKHHKPLAFHTGFSDVDWFFGYGDLMMMDGCMCESGDTPQDAACKLAITMFKQGIIKRE